MAQRYYPPRSDFQTHEQWDAHIKTYQMVYDLQDQLAAAQKKLAQHEKDIAANASNIGRQAVVSNINGISISKQIAQNGQKLTYNSVTGQIEWQ
jgi:ABC-type Fe3+-citrate transport system substrate-binding protein